MSATHECDDPLCACHPEAKAATPAVRSAYRNRTDAELALLVRHRRTLVKHATEQLAEALAEQAARAAGETGYEEPAPLVPWFPQGHCLCCWVPMPATQREVCLPCEALHGLNPAPYRDGEPTCERAVAAVAGRQELIDSLASTLRTGPGPSKETQMRVAEFAGLDYAPREPRR